MRLTTLAAALLLPACSTAPLGSSPDAGPVDHIGDEWPGECADVGPPPGDGLYRPDGLFRYEIGGEGTVSGPEAAEYTVDTSRGAVRVSFGAGSIDPFWVDAREVGGCHVTAEWGTAVETRGDTRAWVCETECGTMIGILEPPRFMTAGAVKE